MKRITAVLVALLAIQSGRALAQMVVTNTTPKVVGFHNSIGWDGVPNVRADPLNDGNDVYAANLTLTAFYGLMEEQNSFWYGFAGNAPLANGFSAGAWSMSHTGWDPDGAGALAAGDRSKFDDLNNDGDKLDAVTPSALVGTATVPVIAVKTGTEEPIFGGANDRGLLLGVLNDRADSTLTLRVKNGTGGYVTRWRFAVDTWYSDSNDSLSDLKVRYSTDDSAYTDFGTRAGVNTASAWSSMQTLGGWFSATVADGGYLYLQIAETRTAPFKDGCAWALDNITVESTPPAKAGVVFSLE